MARKTTKNETLQDTLKRILEVENKAYEDAGINRRFIIAFPNRQKVPLLGKLGVHLFTKAGGTVQVSFEKRDNK